MTKRTMVIASLMLVAAFGTGARAGDAPAAENCKRVGASGTAWVHPGTGPDAARLWVARPDCRAVSTPKKPYRAVSGGYRFEGIWNDASMAAKWQVVGSEPYVSTGVENVDGWQCMVMSTGTGAPELPGPIWCAVTCCPE